MGENCNEDPCKAFREGTGAVCYKMATCQSDRCNYNYATATMAGPPTIFTPNQCNNRKILDFQFINRRRRNFTVIIRGIVLLLVV